MTKHYPALSGVVFDKDSPFRRLPHNLDSTQRRFCEGIRFAIEMTQLSSVRLRSVLSPISLKRTHEIEGIPDSVACAFQDAWSMIDSVHRLRELIFATPNMQKRGPLYEIFVRTSAAVEQLRNHVQHLKGDIINPQLANYPIWGTLGWLWVVDPPQGDFLSGMLTAGSSNGMIQPILVPNNRVYHDRLDHITLSFGDCQADLSEVMRIIVRMARALEATIKPQFEGQEISAPLDMLMLLEIKTQQQGDPATVEPSFSR